MDSIRPCIESTGTWSFRSPRTRNGRQESQCCYNGDQNFVNFLKRNDFGEKKLTSPTKIIDFLGESLLPYFLLGFLDGDGSICFRRLKSGYYKPIMLGFYGPYYQDWGWLSNICSNLLSRYVIRRRSRNIGRSSSLELNGSHAKNILNFVYSTNYPFCLYRKKIKYLSYTEYQSLPSKLRKNYQPL